MSAFMAPTIGPKTPVTHRTEIWHGIGLVIRLVRHDRRVDAEVQWPGVDFTRRESLADLDAAQFPMAWPLPAERRRRSAYGQDHDRTHPRGLEKVGDDVCGKPITRKEVSS